jgi:hypothetical protein
MRVTLAALVPLVGAALAYALWWISDRLLYVGPLDRAQFGWLVVVPVWSLTPVATAFAWRTLGGPVRATAAGVIGFILAVVSAALFWSASAFPNCEFGAVRSPGEWVIPSAIVGLVIGGGFAIVCLGATAAARRARWWVVVAAGAGSAFALVFLAVLVATPFLMSGACQRPL